MAELLFFVEDPGAANYVAELPAVMESDGISCSLFACGAALPYLRQRGVSCQPYDSLTKTPRDILEELRPRVVVAGTAENPDSPGLDFIAQARASSITTVGVIDAFMNFDRRFKGRTCDPLAFAPDYLFVPDQWIGDAFSGSGFPKSRIIVCGHPHYDFVHEQRAAFSRGNSQLRLPRDAEGKKVISFFSEPDSTAFLDPDSSKASEKYTLRGRGSSDKRADIVIEEFVDALKPFRHECFSVLRLHPRGDPLEFSKYHSEFDHVSRTESALELIYLSDIVVGTTSMALIESVLLKKLTLSILPHPEEADFLPVLRNPMSRIAHTRDSVESELKALLSGTLAPSSAADEFFPYGSRRKTADALRSLLA